MKYAVILGDGMAGYPLPDRGNKTCLQLAKKPFIDELATHSLVGLCRTVPAGFKPGSDVANLSVMGYDPALYYTGRSPLEAASIGIPLKDTDATLRCNLVTLSEDEPFAQKTMVDYSAGEISTAEAKELVAFLKEQFDSEIYTLYAGVSYRHCLVVSTGVTGGTFTPPHDISGRKIADYLPQNAETLLNIMKEANRLLMDHPINEKRRAAGKNPANAIWFWGEGTKPRMRPFAELHGKKGAVISAVDLVKGIGRLAEMKVIEVEGATGNWDTNFQGKANACVDALLEGYDYVYVHMEGPDECGHHGDVAKKVFCIEQIDGVVKTVCSRLRAAGEDFAILLCPDHPTPIALKTHTSDPIPFLLYDSRTETPNTPAPQAADAAPASHAPNGATAYDEAEAAKTGLFIPRGWELIDLMMKE